jgi:HK97 family phage portal protein
MGLINWLKRLTDRTALVDTTITPLTGVGLRGSKHKEFDDRAAIKRFASWAYVAANLNANQVAATPLRLYARTRQNRQSYWSDGEFRRVPSGRKLYLMGQKEDRPSSAVVNKLMDFGEDFQEITAPHPLRNVLRTVNPWMNGYDFTVTRMLYLQLTGNWYVMRIDSGVMDFPSELWPLPSQDVQLIVDRGGDKLIAGYLYGHGREYERSFALDEIIWGKLPNPRDPFFYGMGKMEAAWTVLSLHESKREVDVNWFANNQRPDWVAVVKSGASTEQIEAFERKVRMKMRGTRNSGKMLAITGDVKLEALNVPPVELGDPDRVLDEIAAVFAVPRAKLMGNQNVPGGGPESSDVNWMRDGILPLLRMDEEKLNETLLANNEDLCLAYDNPVPEDKQQVLEERKATVGVGISTANEVRAEMGMDPHPNPMADELLWQGKPLGVSAPAPMMAPGQEPQDQPQATAYTFPDNTSWFRTSVKFGSISSKTVDNCDSDWPPETKEARSKLEGLGDAGDTQREGEPLSIALRLAERLERLFTLQERAMLLGLSGLQAPDLASLLRITIASVESLVDEMRGDLAELIVEISDVGIEVGLERLGVGPPDIEPPDIVTIGDFSRDYSLKLAGEINQTSIERLKASIGQGLDNDEDLGQLTERVQAQFDGFKRSRSKMIARTESARAFVGSELLAWHKSGIVEGKLWLLAPDACEFCRAIEKHYRNKILPLGDNFAFHGGLLTGVDGGQMRLDYSDISGPPLHPNCRCDLIPILKD